MAPLSPLAPAIGGAPHGWLLPVRSSPVLFHEESLLLPPSGAVKHTLRRGETCWQLGGHRGLGPYKASGCHGCRHLRGSSRKAGMALMKDTSQLPWVMGS